MSQQRSFERGNPSLGEVLGFFNDEELNQKPSDSQAQILRSAPWTELEQDDYKSGLDEELDELMKVFKVVVAVVFAVIFSVGGLVGFVLARKRAK